MLALCALLACQKRPTGSYSSELSQLDDAEFVLQYLENAYTFNHHNFLQKQNLNFTFLSSDLRQQKEAELQKLMPKIQNGKISQVGRIKSLNRLSQKAFLADVQIYILEDAKVTNFWIQVKIELNPSQSERTIEKLMVDASKEKRDFATSVGLQEDGSLRLVAPCAITSVHLQSWPQSDLALLKANEVKIKFAKIIEGNMGLNCEDKKFSIPITVGTPIQQVFYRIDDEWTVVEPSKVPKDREKSLDGLKHSIEKELGFSFK